MAEWRIKCKYCKRALHLYNYGVHGACLDPVCRFEPGEIGHATEETVRIDSQKTISERERGEKRWRIFKRHGLVNPRKSGKTPTGILMLTPTTEIGNGRIGGKMNNIDIIAGARYKGKVNDAIIEVVKIVNPNDLVFNPKKELEVLYKDCRTGKFFTYGLEAFKRCSLEIIEKGVKYE